MLPRAESAGTAQNQSRGEAALALAAGNSCFRLLSLRTGASVFRLPALPLPDRQTLLQLHAVQPTKPMAQPPDRVAGNRVIDRAHLPESEVVRPAGQGQGAGVPLSPPSTPSRVGARCASRSWGKCLGRWSCLAGSRCRSFPVPAAIASGPVARNLQGAGPGTAGIGFSVVSLTGSCGTSLSRIAAASILTAAAIPSKQSRIARLTLGRARNRIWASSPSRLFPASRFRTIPSNARTVACRGALPLVIRASPTSRPRGQCVEEWGAVPTCCRLRSEWLENNARSVPANVPPGSFPIGIFRRHVATSKEGQERIRRSLRVWRDLRGRLRS